MFELIKNDIEELTGLIKKIENIGDNWIGIKNEEQYPLYEELIYDVMCFLYKKKLIISFNWPDWYWQGEGKIFYDNNDPQKYDNLNREFILKYLSTIARMDKFSDYFWYRLFESGSGLILLKKLLETYNN